MLGVVIDGDDAILAEARVVTPHTALDPVESHKDPVESHESHVDPAAGGDRRGSAPAIVRGGRPAAGVEVADAVAQVVGSLHRQLQLDGRAGGSVRARARGSVPAGGSVPPGGRVPVGVGAPGMLDRQGVLHFSPNLQGASGADLRSLVADRLPGTPVVLENDANCAALAELRMGAVRGVDDALVVTLGTGIGGGIVRGDRVLVGASGFAGEIGHMVVDPSGPPCPCGRRGCWERYASGGGLARLAREAAYAGRLNDVVMLAGGDPELVRGEDVTRAARRGDQGALGVMDELGWWIALGLTNLTAVLDPERIVLGGGLGEAEEMLLAPTRRAFAHLVEGAGARPDIEIVVAELGERAGAVGAAMVARAGGLG